MRTWQGGTDGGEELMRALYAAHGAVLQSFVRRFVADHGRAEDVVQEVMLRVWRTADRLNADCGDLRSYLFTVARKLVIDQWRAEQARPRMVDQDEAAEVAQVEDEVDRVIESMMITDALQRLSPEHQVVVHEIYFRGQSVNETAARLNLPAGTVKSRTYYAVRALRAAFNDMGVTR